MDERLAARPTKPGTLDLTSARWFIEKEALHATLVDAVRTNAPDNVVALRDGKQIKLYFAVKLLLLNLNRMHAIWRCKEPYNSEQVECYHSAVETFGVVWEGLG